MARVRILEDTAEHRAGEVIDLPGAEASALADGVRAELVRAESIETPEGRQAQPERP